MDCRETNERLTGWALDELEAGVRAAVAAHLRDCATCRAEAESTAAALRDVRSWEDRPHKAARVDRTAAAMRQAYLETTVDRPVVRWLLHRPALGAAAALLLAAGAFFAGTAFAPRGAQRGDPVASLRSTVGEVWVQPGDGSGWSRAAEGSELREGDRLQTRPGAYAEVELGGGSVEVREDSLLQFGRRERTGRLPLTLGYGALWFDLPSAAGEQILVETTEGRVDATGGTFEVECR